MIDNLYEKLDNAIYEDDEDRDYKNGERKCNKTSRVEIK